MSNLSAFMAQNAQKIDNVKHVASKRFIDDKGKPMEWEVKCITVTEDEAIRKSCTKRVQVPGKKNMYTPETDYNLYLGKLAVTCTVFPNLNDAELQNSYGVMGADVLLKTMLNSGEYTDYIAKIQEINGFEATFEDTVEDAKN